MMLRWLTPNALDPVHEVVDFSTARDTTLRLHRDDEFSDCLPKDRAAFADSARHEFSRHVLAPKERRIADRAKHLRSVTERRISAGPESDSKTFEKVVCKPTLMGAMKPSGVIGPARRTDNNSKCRPSATGPR